MKVLEHLTEKDIERYGARVSSSAETLAAQEHVGECAACRTRLERALDTDAAFNSLRAQFSTDAVEFEDEPTHLPYEQLTLYVDNKLDEVEREIADSHLAICQECAGDIADLRQYQVIAAAPAAEPAKATARAVVPAMMETEATATAATPTFTPERLATPSEKAGRWWQRLFAFDFFPSFGALVPAGMAAALLIVVLLGIWFAMRSNIGSNRQVAKVETPNSTGTTSSPIETKSPNTVSNPNDNTANNSTDNRNASNTSNTPIVGTSTSPQTLPLTPQNGKSQNGATTNNLPSTVTLNDSGSQVAFDSAGNSNSLESLPSSIRQAVRRSIASQGAQTPRALDALVEGRTGVLMSGSAETTNKGVPFALLSPVGKVTREQQPVLRWRALAGAKSYTVAIVDSNFRVIAQSSNLTATEWKPAQNLPRGLNYSWQVTATQTDGVEVVSPVSPAPQAKFRVMEQSAFDEVTRIENSGVKSHLARGVIYAQAGLVDEARTEFEALVHDNPHSQLARKLLNSVRKN
jgi:anti-sigma factor RsiW